MTTGAPLGQGEGQEKGPPDSAWALVWLKWGTASEPQIPPSSQSLELQLLAWAGTAL